MSLPLGRFLALLDDAARSELRVGRFLFSAALLGDFMLWLSIRILRIVIFCHFFHLAMKYSDSLHEPML